MNEAGRGDAKRRARELYFKPCFMWLGAFGLNPLAFLSAVRGFGFAVRDFYRLRAQNRRSEQPFRLRFSMPCFADRYESGGNARGHYFHQNLLVARRIFERQPRRHMDVGSRVDGFVAHVASFRDIEVFDIRPTLTVIPHITFLQADLMAVSGEHVNCCDSLSCLHALEHFGLGRYGDPIDAQGHVCGFGNLTRILQPGGILYVSVPIGPERIDFNANRVFSIQTILNLAREEYELLDFSYVDDAGAVHESVELTAECVSSQFGCVYGCGIFEFRKNIFRVR